MTFPILDWHLNDRVPDALEHLGRIPLLFNPDSADPAWLQVQTNYPKGWNPVMDRERWTLTADDYLIYQGLAPLPPVACVWLRSERILVYPAGWVVVVELGGDFTVARIEP